MSSRFRVQKHSIDNKQKRMYEGKYPNNKDLGVSVNGVKNWRQRLPAGFEIHSGRRGAKCAYVNVTEYRE